MELLAVVAAVALLGLVALGVLKLFFWILVLPFKLAAFVAKGILGLVFLIPALVLWAFAASFALPVFVGLLALPVMFFVLGIIALVRFIV